MMRPFFTYYGGKYRLAPRYPEPIHQRVIEPFAGSAGYATRWNPRHVTLIDADPVIAGLWDYLIHVSADEVMSLPLYDGSWETVDELNVPQEAKWLIGFWLNKGTTHPCKAPSKWMREGGKRDQFWSARIRQRVAQQVPLIRHWTVIHGSYENAPDVEATWFIDPPYNNKAGRHYRNHDIDYDHLASWSQSRRGQVIVCENAGAKWLSFQPFHDAKATAGSHRTGISPEVVWERDDWSLM